MGPFLSARFGGRLFLSFGAACLVCGCLVREKTGKTASSWVPSWDTSQYAPGRLENFHYQGPESLFTVFHRMEEADSMVKAEGVPVPSTEPVDTLRIHHLFDTGFVFPASSEAAMPYAYDSYYRDDTLFRKAYGNGLFDQEHPCVESWVLSEPFLHPARWVSSELTQEDIVAVLGTPFVRHPMQIRYRWKSQSKEGTGDSAAHFESMRFYFRNDSLYALLLQRAKPCF